MKEGKKKPICNVSVIGEVRVGKTAIASALLGADFSDHYHTTVGVNMVRLQYKVGTEVKMFFLWDTAGTEKYRALAPVYYRDSNGALIVYDVGSRLSFEKLGDWVELYRKSVGREPPIMIIGNKIDLEDREVTEEEAAAWAKSRDFEYVEVSAKTRKNIDVLFAKMTQILESALPRAQVELVSRKDEGGCC
jgi:small GTP-binding protein